MGWFLRLPKCVRQSERRTDKPRPRKFSLPPYHHELIFESLEDRRLLTVSLTWPGAGSTLSLTEGTSGATPAIVISEPSPNVSLLKIDLGSGHVFAGTSTTSATGLTYQNAGSPTTSEFATINIGLTNDVSLLQATLPGDGLTLGQIRDLQGGLGSITASAATIAVAGINTMAANGTSGAGNVALELERQPGSRGRRNHSGRYRHDLAGRCDWRHGDALDRGRGHGRLHECRRRR